MLLLNVNIIYYRMMNKHNRQKIDIDEDQMKEKLNEQMKHK